MAMLLHCLKRCRMRHVKCDEEKPACYECRRTGRICDGYDNQKSKAQNDVPSMLYSKIYGLSSAAIADFHHTFLKSEEERRCYEYFQCRARQQINDTFQSSHRVHQLILQGSQGNESIKHSVIALGSLVEHLNTFKLLSESARPGKQRLHFADTQYVKSIRRLQEYMTLDPGPSPEMVLTSCLLLSLFDFLRGEEAEARIHLSAGIDILRRCFASKLTHVLEEDPSKADYQPDLMIQDFARVFSVMDLHSAIWLGRPCFHSLPLLYPATNLMPYVSRGGDPLDELSTDLNYQIMRAHSFHHLSAPNFSTVEEHLVPFHITAQKGRLLFELLQWSASMYRCSSTLPSPSEEQRDRIVLMEMNRDSLFVTINSFFMHPSSASCPSSSSAFCPKTGRIDPQKLIRSIVTTASALLRTTSDAPQGNIPDPPSTKRDRPHHHIIRAIKLNCQQPDTAEISIFGFVPGVIQPLYLAATKSNDASVSEEAIALLETKPWREGAWDSATMARLARRELASRNALMREGQ